MKTKKYKKLVEDNGYKYYENNYSITARKYSEEHYDIEIKVGKLRPGVLEVNIKGFCGDELDIILKAMELAETPPEDREEEKKFYLKHKYLMSVGGSVQYFTTHTSFNFPLLKPRIFSSKTKQQFTREEIEKIKDKFDTDLKDFKEDEVKE